MTEQEMQLQITKEQDKVNALRQEVAEMNKEREYWQQVRIQSAIAAMQGIISNTGRCAAVCEIAREDGMTPKQTLVATSVEIADALVAELKGGEQ